MGSSTNPNGSFSIKLKIDSVKDGDKVTGKVTESSFSDGEMKKPVKLPKGSKVSSPHLPRLAYLCLLYTSPSPRDQRGSRMPSSA